MDNASYFGNVNNTLLQMVDPTATRICEFGCGSGALARAIKAKTSTSIHYVGVELIASELTKAMDTLDIGLTRNLDQIKNWRDDPEMASSMPLSTFDHVIFGDVLEHLYEPDLVLEQAVACLKPGGSALVCIPNVQHWSVLFQLIKGSWPRHTQGLFDRTHIRWFTLADMVSLLRKQGLTVEKVVPRIFDPDRGQAFIDKLLPAAEFSGIPAERFRQLTLPLQYVLLGRKR